MATQKRRKNAETRPTRRPKARQPATPKAIPLVARPVASFDFCRSLVRSVPDFPSKGVLFKDITPLLANPRALHIVLDGIAERFIGEHINASFVPVRKPGKLPAAVDRVEIVTEYSRDALEMHKGSLHGEDRVVIVDDVLATGGTASAAASLVHGQGAYVIGYAFVIELSALAGRERLLPSRVESCLVY